MEKEANTKQSLESEITRIVSIFLEKSKNKEIQVISHFDTDGITSAAIMIKTLKKLNESTPLANACSAVANPHTVIETTKPAFVPILSNILPDTDCPTA